MSGLVISIVLMFHGLWMYRERSHVWFDSTPMVFPMFPMVKRWYLRIFFPPWSMDWRKNRLTGNPRLSPMNRPGVSCNFSLNPIRWHFRMSLHQGLPRLTPGFQHAATGLVWKHSWHDENRWNGWIVGSGWWFEPLWKIWKSNGMIIPNIWENKKWQPNHQPGMVY